MLREVTEVVELSTGRDIAYSRLLWRCRRGMRELDAVLEGFLRAAYAALSGPEKSSLARILDLPDPELFGYLTGRSQPSDPDVAALIERIRTTPRASA
jgi:antitoxin CptB